MLGEHNGFAEAHKQVGHEDYERMHQTVRAFRNPRWTPLWALDDKKVRMVVYEHLWNYAKRINSLNRRPGMSLKQLEALCQNTREFYAERASLLADPSQAHILSEHVRTTEKGIAAQMVQLIYKAYRERLPAPDIAELMHMTPDAVRIRLYRLNRIARRLFTKEDCSAPHWTANSDGQRRPPRKQCTTRGNWMPRITPELLELAERYNGGETLVQLSAAIGRPVATISWQLRRRGLANKKNAGQFKPKPVAADTLEIVRLHAEGESYASLARKSGININTLQGRLRTLRRRRG